MPRKPATCHYPGCGIELDNHRPYAYSGLLSVTGVIDFANFGKANAMPWAAAEIAATFAVHEVERLWSHDSAGCTLSHKIVREDGSPGLCGACRLIRYEFKKRWDAKANLGTHVHHLAVSWAEGQDIDTDPAIDPRIDDLELFYKQYKPKWLFVERTVHYRGGPREYVGTFDAICEIDCPLHPGQRCVWLVDIKTGDKWEHEWVLQLAAYRFADWMTTWQDGKQAWDCRMYPVAHVGVIWLDGDGNDPCWRRAPRPLVTLEVNQEAHNQFLRLVDLVAWEKRQAISMKERDRDPNKPKRGRRSQAAERDPGDSAGDEGPAGDSEEEAQQPG